MQLREYQEDLLSNARIKFSQGNKRVLCVLPCGAGKTVCFAYMAMRHKGYVWFLVHRRELIDQTIETFNKFGINMDNIYIGMVGSKLPTTPPTLIIFDEAHHSSAKTWKRIIDMYPNVYFVGLTATPCRLDGKPLGAIYQAMVEGVSANWLIENGYLCEYDYYAPKNLIDNFKKESDNELFEYKPAVYGNVLKYIDQAKKTIIYCPNIAFSEALAKQIPNAKHFDGNTSKKERAEIIKDFRSGKIRVLLNVDLIGEGFDVPDCDCVMLLRPTMSTALYIQQSMRCLRPAPNKRAVIYDFVGNVFRHGLPTDDRKWSLNTQVKVRNSNAEPDILTRQCKKCYRVYSGIGRICPYCNNDNGKTRKQIEIEEKEEMEQIKKIERREVGMARDFKSLVEIGKKRGYKNPSYWAACILRGRNGKI